MYAEERQRAIVEQARRDGRVEVAQLAEDLAVTPETIRRDLTHLEPEVIDRQLQALAAAAEDAPCDVWTMAPMIATVAEARGFTSRARALGLSTVGVMVEVPLLALQADRLVDVVDFVSIGTNDLSQYAFAADRLVGELGALLDPWQQALPQLVARVADAGSRSGVPVGVCGEAASDPLL
ncbi:MAG TPA: putative PEP-binding protein, partial [Euzebya sp.]|nr:putative PEP-binding protein [Euzebya sp.]